MNDVIYRSVAPGDLEVRTAGDGRTVSGILVPWEHEVRIPQEGITESFARGAFDAQVRAAGHGRIHFAREHVALGGVPIGRVTMLRNDAHGLYGEMRVAPTATGDETLALIKDGVLDHLSVGFKPGQNRSTGPGVVQRVRATLNEVAATLKGAYGDAAIVTGVRSAAPGCPTCAAQLERRAHAAEAARLEAGLPILPSVREK